MKQERYVVFIVPKISLLRLRCKYQVTQQVLESLKKVQNGSKMKKKTGLKMVKLGSKMVKKLLKTGQIRFQNGLKSA